MFPPVTLGADDLIPLGWTFFLPRRRRDVLRLVLLAGTGAETLLQEADLLAERIDAVELLEGVSQEGGFLGQALIQRQREEAVERSQN